MPAGAQNSSRQSAHREAVSKLFADNLAAGMVSQIDSGRDGKRRRLSYLSPAVEKLHGLKRDAVLQNPLLLYRQVIEEDGVIPAEKESRAFATRKPLDIEVRVRLPSGEIRWRHFKSAPRTLPDKRIVWDGIELDVTDRKLAEIALRDSEEMLRRKNAALTEIVAQIEMERVRTRNMVAAGIERFAMPIIRILRRNAGRLDRKHLDLLEDGLKKITSQIGAGAKGLHSLSSRESDICGMIRSGASNKDIAQALGISPRTVDTFRNRIRKKLGIVRKDVNLYTHLHELAGDPARR